MYIYQTGIINKSSLYGPFKINISKNPRDFGIEYPKSADFYTVVFHFLGPSRIFNCILIKRNEIVHRSGNLVYKNLKGTINDKYKIKHFYINK